MGNEAKSPTSLILDLDDFGDCIQDGRYTERRASSIGSTSVKVIEDQPGIDGHKHRADSQTPQNTPEHEKTTIKTFKNVPKHCPNHDNQWTHPSKCEQILRNSEICF